MAKTPLYKRMRKNATSFYAFPGAGEDISAAYQNENYRMYFSKFALVSLPKQQLDGDNKQFDFSEAFKTSSSSNPTIGYSDQMIESLRNYVANHEVTIKDSMLNSSEGYYDNSALKTTSEKIFWKWCKKLGLLEFEVADPNTDFVSDSDDFETRNINDSSYFPETLWKERSISNIPVLSYYQSDSSSFGNNLEIEFNTKIDIRVGDIIYIKGELTNFNNRIETNDNEPISELTEDHHMTIVEIGESSSGNTTVVVNYTTSLSDTLGTGEMSLVYNRLVQYIGEIHGTNNVQDSNEAFTSVYAHIPAHTGQTPTVLFRTEVDENYKPGMTFPIIPSQNQAEIIGAESFNSPLVSSPQNYPGGYFAQYDNDYFQYTTSTGDEVRRTGEYYGVDGDIEDVVYSPDTIDGLVIDFNTEHYAQMNVVGRDMFAFEQYNSLGVNQEPPKDFDFNAILWYYTVEDNNGNSADNLYGITFVNHPDNNEIEEEHSIRVPSLKKYVTTDDQDGTSYSYSLNLSFRIDNDNPKELYNPESINSLFSFNHYNEAMTRLSETNDRFMNIFTQFSGMKQDIDGLRQLVYTNTNLNTLNAKIAKIESLVNLYSTNQIVSSDTIQVVTNRQSNPPEIQLVNTDYIYGDIVNVSTKNMYNNGNITPFPINTPINKPLLINIINNDDVDAAISDGSNLTLVINNDLSFKQSIDIRVRTNSTSTTNKKLDIYINSSLDSNSGEVVNTPLITDIDLPIAYNVDSNSLNSSMTLDKLNINIDDTATNNMIILDNGSIIKFKIRGSHNILTKVLRVGDIIRVEDFGIIVSNTDLDFSGQYEVVGIENGYIVVDTSTNDNLYSYQNSGIAFPHDMSGLLSKYPSFGLNKGYNINITRTSQSESSDIEYSNVYYSGSYYSINIEKL